MGNVRTVAQLTDVADPAWPRVLEWVDEGGVGRVLAPNVEQATITLFRLQVTTRSTLGALASCCGGIVVDDGWLRILGGGTTELVDLAMANGLGEPHDDQKPPGHLVVAQDVLGGCFAVNGGDLPAEPGEVAYWGPDTLDWTAWGAGHSDFVRWALTGGATDFYEDLRWRGWRETVGQLGLDQGLSVYPPPSTVEGQVLDGSSKGAVPMSELVAFNHHLAKVTSGHEGPFMFRVTD